MVRISPEDYNKLKKEGYSDAEIEEAIYRMEEQDLSPSQQDNQNPRNNSNISSFSTREDENLIKWQLELNDILERAEHILKGDIPTFENGNIVWKDNPEPEKNCLNKEGVQAIMKILAMYVNRNKILSDYSNKEINLKVFDFARTLNNLIFMKDVEYGMDTQDKRKEYDMLVNELKDIIHDTYKRALEGSEKRSLREMITISQASSTSANLGNMEYNPQGQPARTRGLLNPLRYTQGKYY